MTRPNRTDHIRLTSHPAPGAKPRFPIVWGAPTARERGPVVATVSRPLDRNVIGTHGGSYAVYRALAVSSGALNPIQRADLTNTKFNRVEAIQCTFRHTRLLECDFRDARPQVLQIIRGQ